MERKTKTSKATRNYYLDLFTLVPFLFLLISGLVVLRYHGGTDHVVETIGLNGDIWLLVHKVCAVTVLPLIVTHLWLHAYWVKNIFSKKKKSKNNDMNISLFVVFSLCVLTAFLAWLVFSGKPVADLLREVHNKLGFALIFFFIVHLKNYFKWLLTMTKKSFGKKK